MVRSDRSIHLHKMYVYLLYYTRSSGLIFISLLCPEGRYSGIVNSFRGREGTACCLSGPQRIRPVLDRKPVHEVRLADRNRPSLSKVAGTLRNGESGASNRACDVFSGMRNAATTVSAG